MRRHQRGFIYLTTGANGAGKTLFTLKAVQELALKESRPVAYNGRFDMAEDGPLKAWKKIDFKDWQAEPDGTIFVIDECQHDLPLRPKAGPPPDYIAALTEHRKRGFDFFMITQHPSNIDVYVRRLIGSPGWHRHLKRTFGAHLVSQLEWASVKTDCEKAGSGESGDVKMVPFPKEVYGWYKSANLHTGKTRIPKAVFVVAACALLVPALIFGAWKSFTGGQQARQENVTKLAGNAPSAKPDGMTTYRQPVLGAGSAKAAPAMTPAEYISARTPRLEGWTHTAPAYDSLTAPAVVPYPAACLYGTSPRTKKNECTCYTTQGTLLPTPADTCKQIVAQGFFIEWHREAKPEGVTRAIAPPIDPDKPLPGTGNVTPASVTVSQAAQPVPVTPEVQGRPRARP